MTAALLILATLTAVGIDAWLKHADDKRCPSCREVHRDMPGHMAWDHADEEPA